MKIEQLICETKIDSSFSHLCELIKKNHLDDDFSKLVCFVSDLRDNYELDMYNSILNIDNTTNQEIDETILHSLNNCITQYTKNKSDNITFLYKNTQIFDKLSKIQIDGCIDFLSTLDKLNETDFEDLTNISKSTFVIIKKIIHDKNGLLCIKKMTNICNLYNNNISKKYFKNINIDGADVNEEFDDLCSFLNCLCSTVIAHIEKLFLNKEHSIKTNMITCDMSYHIFTQLLPFIETIPRLKIKMFKILPADYRYDPQYKIDQQYSCVTPYVLNHKKIIDAFNSIETQLLSVADKNTYL